MEGVLQGEAWAEIIADMEDRKVALVWDRAGIDVEGRGQLKSLKLVMMQDNAAAVTLLQGPGGSWRTRPLQIRARSARERFENGFWALQHLPGEMMLADIGTKALGSSRLRALAKMMGMKMGESDAIPEKVGEGNAAKARVVRSIEHERGLLTGITCITLADAACMEDEEASREELLFWTALLVAVVAAWEALKWSERRAADAVRNLEKGEDCRSMSTTGGGVKVKAMQGGKERAMQRLLEKRAERESSEERQERSTEGGGSPGSSSAADGLEKEVDRAGNSHERNAGWKAGGGEARQTGLAPEKSFAAEWKVSLDEDDLGGCEEDLPGHHEGAGGDRRPLVGEGRLLHQDALQKEGL